MESFLEKMPEWARRPYYPVPPYHQKAYMMYCVWTVKENLIRPIVPPELELINNEVAGWVTIYPLSTCWGTFREGAIAIRVKMGDMIGLYFVQLYLSGDVVMTNCREVYGFPKKMGKMELSTGCETFCSKEQTLRQDTIVGTVERNGVKLMTLNMQMLKFADISDVPLGEYWFNLKVVPSVDYNKLKPELAQLTVCKPENIELDGRVMAGPATVSFEKTPVDNLWRFEPEKQPVDGWYFVFDFDLPGGKVLKSYI